MVRLVIVWLFLENVDCGIAMVGIADIAGRIVAYDRSNRTSVMTILGDNEVPDRKEANGRRDAVHAPLQ